jgi:nucleoside 2-deoxyribosyltransferase
LNAPPQYALPSQLDALMASAARYFKHHGKGELVTILANARVEVIEGDHYDNWDGGTTGHAVRLHLPEELLHLALPEGVEHGTEIRTVLNKLAQVSNEHFSDVRVCLDLGAVPTDWRKETEALLASPILAATSDTDRMRLWGQGSPRVFLSHRADFKTETKQLKEELAKYGAASFVAHEDIEPTRAWQTEIERALASADVLVAALTTGFAGSAWTNQEVGVALGRGIPVVSLRITEDPVAFVGHLQALPGHGRTVAEHAKALVAAFSGYPRLTHSLLSGLVRQWEKVVSFPEAIRIMDLLDASNSMPSELLARIEAAYASNNQLHGSVVVYRKYPAFIARMKAAAEGKQ